jgi:hypothetical protein
VAEGSVGDVVSEELPGVADYAVAGFEVGDVGANGVNFTSEIVAGDDGPFFDEEAGLLGGIVGVDCYGVVADDDVVGAWGGDVAVGDAEGGVGGVDEGGAVGWHFGLIVLVICLLLIWSIDLVSLLMWLVV